MEPAAAPNTGKDRSVPGKILLTDGRYTSWRNGTVPQVRHKATHTALTRCTARNRGIGDEWGMLVRNQFGGSKVPADDLSEEERQENLRYPKSTIGCGRRWLVEIAISAIKRMFGEDVTASGPTWCRR